MKSTVTVTRVGSAFYSLTFSRMPHQTLGPYDFVETIRHLRVAALLEPLKARNLVMDAHERGAASDDVE